jgi:hypothetical protein
LTGLGEEIREAPGATAQISVVSRTGKAGRVEEEASASLAEPRKSHGEILGTRLTNRQ